VRCPSAKKMCACERGKRKKKKGGGEEEGKERKRNNARRPMFWGKNDGQYTEEDPGKGSPNG